MNSKYNQIKPQIHASCYVADSAEIIGDVKIGKDCSIWPTAVLRGDVSGIEVGEGTNLQDGVIVHGDVGLPVKIGKNITVGHRAIIHGCTLGDHCLIGMGAIVLNKAVIGKNSLVAAGSVVKEGAIIPDNSLVAGSPAVVKSQLSERILKRMQDGNQGYIELARQYQ